MEEIYHTIITSERHKDMGYCEPSDFGKITLIRATEEEAPAICNIRDYHLNQTLRLFKGYYYNDFDTWDNKFHYAEKQGRLTDNTAKLLMVELRKEQESRASFSGAYSQEFLLVGRRIFVKFCKKSKLCITQTGNTIFGDWWSLDIEPFHVNKKNIVFNRKNFERVLTATKKWVDKRNKGRKTKIHFSYPRVKWLDNEE